MARRRLNDTEAIASKPVVETSNPDYSCFHATKPSELSPELARPTHNPAPDHGRTLRGAVCYLNSGLDCNTQKDHTR